MIIRFLRYEKILFLSDYFAGVKMWDEYAIIIGGILIISSWIPQIIKLIRTRSSKDISLIFLMIITSGTILLIPHSIIINDIFFIVLNSTAASIAFVTLLLAWYYRKNKSEAAQRE